MTPPNAPLPGDPSLPPGTTDADVDGPVEQCPSCGRAFTSEGDGDMCLRCRYNEDRNDY